MRDVLDDDLAELYPVRPADDVRMARLREQLFAGEPAPRSRRWIGIAAAAVAVMVIAGLVVTLRPASRDAPATLPTIPATSLLEAATMLETAEKPTAKYQHITYLLWEFMSGAAFGDPNYGSVAAEFRFDVWLPTAPGQTVVISRKLTGQRRMVGGNPPPADRTIDLANIPDLWDSFCAATPCKEDSLAQPLPPDPAKKLKAASAALLSPFTTNEEKAALYRTLAQSPEIRWNDGKLSVDGSLTEFTIDPATGRVSGMRELNPWQNPSLPEGIVPRSVTVTYEWTDQRPS
ncbi:hypothetical protein [Lentzea kentuckyensis]|uniref:hypothetical protein n=1 Tax=Lentzea kentuckyensis TaxID=360086 RepID=UPI000A39F755|nr:hypothetical protein [Lentzea kentuckyensis]